MLPRCWDLDAARFAFIGKKAFLNNVTIVKANI